MIIPDAQLVVEFFLSPPSRSVAARVYERDRTWAAPTTWRMALRDRLAAQVVAGQITLEQARLHQRAAVEMVGPREVDVRGHDLLSLAVQTGCTGLDCEYACLAGLLEVPLVTYREPLLAALPGRAFSPEAFAGGAGAPG